MSGSDCPLNANSIPLNLWKLTLRKQEASAPAAGQKEKDSRMVFGVRIAGIKPQFP